MSEFSDRPFAAGSLFGVRSFAVNKDGTLRGPTKPYPWQPGVNEAECHLGDMDRLQRAALDRSMTASMEGMSWSRHLLSCASRGVVNLKKKPKPKAEPTHVLAGMNCRCGYYAYFRNGHNPHHSTFNILGIVEGFGVVTVGSRGFRASKARIVALVRLDRYAEIMVQAFNLGFDQVAANYPNVATFPTLDAALAEFPLTVPEGTPEPEPEVVPQGIVYAAKVGTPFGVGLWQQIGYTSGPMTFVADKPRGPSNETPAERAMRLKRERNTGPANTVGLDGKRRRTA